MKPRARLSIRYSAAVSFLHAAFAGAALTPEVKNRLEQLNQFAVGNTPAEFATFLKENEVRLVQVLKDAGLKTN